MVVRVMIISTCFKTKRVEFVNKVGRKPEQIMEQEEGRKCNLKFKAGGWKCGVNCKTEEQVSRLSC